MGKPVMAIQVRDFAESTHSTMRTTYHKCTLSKVPHPYVSINGGITVSYTPVDTWVVAFVQRSFCNRNQLRKRSLNKFTLLLNVRERSQRTIPDLFKRYPDMKLVEVIADLHIVHNTGARCYPYVPAYH